MARSTALLLALALTPIAAHADESPLRKPGLWEVTSSHEGGPTMPKAQMCLDAASQAQFNAKGKDTMKGFECSKRESHSDGKVFTSDSVCKIMGSTQTSHTVATTVSDDEYTVEISIHAEPPLKYGAADSKMTQHGKWLGPCKADMKPGDMIINGQKIHPGAKP